MVCGMIPQQHNSGGDAHVPERYSISTMTMDDLEGCVHLCRETIGFSRRGELLQSIENSRDNEENKVFCYVPYVLKDEVGQIVAYTSGFHLLGHLVAKQEAHVKHLLCHVCSLIEKDENQQGGGGGGGLELKTRIEQTTAGEADAKAHAVPLFFVNKIKDASLLQWCVNGGMRVAKNVDLMSLGNAYEEPKHYYLPSVVY